MKIYLNFLLTGLTVLALNSTSLAQENTALLTGQVMDTVSKTTLPFATITVSDRPEPYGVLTDENGNYSIDLLEGEHQLKVSYIGFKNKLLKVKVIAGESITRNISMVSPSVLSRPQPGEEVSDLYGHWQIECLEEEGKKIKPNKYERKSQSAGLYFRQFQDHESGIGIFSYSDGCNGTGKFYFRHNGDGEITMNHSMLQTTLKGCRWENVVYQNVHFSKIYDGYTISFESENKVIIENDQIKIVCVRAI